MRTFALALLVIAGHGAAGQDVALVGATVVDPSARAAAVAGPVMVPRGVRRVHAAQEFVMQGRDVHAGPSMRNRTTWTVVGALTGAIAGATAVAIARRQSTDCSACGTNRRDEALIVGPLVGTVAGGSLGWWLAGRDHYSSSHSVESVQIREIRTSTCSSLSFNSAENGSSGFDGSNR